MKKILLIVSSTLLLANSFQAQDDSNFDKKFRFGLRVAAQPTWASSNDNFTSKDKTGFGYGFGLVTEFKLSNIIHLYTGVGGDFENASVKYKNSFVLFPPSGVGASYATDSNGNLIEAKDGTNESTFYSASNTQSILTARKIKVAYITIPIMLKMMTKEIGGFRYYGMFGGELGIRSSIKADDKIQQLSITPTAPYINLVSTTNNNVNIGKDASLIPLRFGLNVGLGTEYRLSGSTAVFLSVNYFHSFTNMMRKDSRYIYTDATTDPNTGAVNFTNLKQGLMMRAIRINLGVMF
jgi:opacity protein-like surface antigen